MVFVCRTLIIADTEVSGVMMPSTSQSTEMFAMSLAKKASAEIFRDEQMRPDGQVSLTLLLRRGALPESLSSFLFGEAQLPCAVIHPYQYRCQAETNIRIMNIQVLPTRSA